MDLKPHSPSADAPRDEYGHIRWGRYNWSSWKWLLDHLKIWDVDVHEFSGMNDGDVISEATCLRVADAIEAHLPELDPVEREWLAPHVALWRTCGGYYQF
jgi:hypothetical protein